MITIPEQLKKTGYEFVLLGVKSKLPIETGWVDKTIFYDDSRLLLHDGNVGIKGGGSNRLVIVDCDTQEIQNNLIAILPETFMVKSGGRGFYHLYYECKGDDELKSFKIQGVVDVQANRKYVVAPNSEHENGGKWSVVNDKPIAQIGYKQLCAIIKSFDTTPAKAEVVKKEYVEPEILSFKDELISLVSLKDVLDYYGYELDGNNKMICPFHKDNNASFQMDNNEQTGYCYGCDTKWNATSFIEKKENCGFKKTLDIMAKICGKEEELKADREKYIAEKKEERMLDSFINYDKKGDFESVNIDAVADYIIKKFDVLNVSGLKEEQINIYEEGIWRPIGRSVIKAECEVLLGEYAKINVVNEIFEKIKRMTNIEKEDFNKVPIYKVCLINGVLDIEDIDNIKFLPHSKEYYFKRKMPIYYNDKAKCPTFLKFLDDSCYPNDINQVQEWFGHHLPKKYLFKKAVIINGIQNSGKSVLVNVLTSFVGIENASGLSLQRISIGKGFDLMALKDMIANIHDDLSSKDLCDGGGFKMAVGDGIINGEEKFGDNVKFRNSAKMTFSCNKIPPVKDIDDTAYYNRWLIWGFDNEVAEDDIDPKLIEKLTTQDELSGILNWAIEGYVRLMKQNKFSNTLSSDEVKSIMVRKGSSLSQFASECLEQANGSKVTKEDMYKAYCDFCMRNKFSPSSKDQLGKQLTRYAPFSIASSNGTDRFWSNTKIKSGVFVTTEGCIQDCDNKLVYTKDVYQENKTLY